MIRQDQLKTIRLAVLQKSKQDVARDLNLPRMRVTRYETGETAAPQNYLNEFAFRYGISFDTIEKLRELENVLQDIERTRTYNH